MVYTDESRQTRADAVPRCCGSSGSATARRRSALADYLAPRETGIADYLGAFAVTAGLGVESLVAAVRARPRRLQRDHGKALADRLAEAFAEMLHKKARDDWGYGRDERLTHDELIDEKYRGIRPAAGYPSCPDHTEKRDLWRLLDVEEADRDRPDRVLRDVARRLGQRPLLRPSRGPLLRRRPDHPRPGRELRGPQGDARQRGRALAGPQPRLRSAIELANVGSSLDADSIRFTVAHASLNLVREVPW